MEPKTIIKEKNNPNVILMVEQLSIQQLIDIAMDSENDNIRAHSKEELFKRGQDNIQSRITVKKACRATISGLEEIIKRFDTGKNNIDKNLLKSYKGKFLTSISILDKLQLEWQRYDLMLKQ